MEGAVALVVAGNAMGTNWKGYYTTSLLEAFARGKISQADLLPDTVKVVIYLGQHIANRYHGRYYARARNIARTLAQAYDSALHDFDLLALPTFPTRATRLPSPDATREERLAIAWAQDPNCCPFNITGHPAMNVPCAMIDGLPVGMMLVGRIGEDGTVLRAAHAFEQHMYAAPRPHPPPCLSQDQRSALQSRTRADQQSNTDQQMSFRNR
jgi:amidase